MHEHTNHDSVRRRWPAVKDRELIYNRLLHSIHHVNIKY
jgi:hypothetical protein